MILYHQLMHSIFEFVLSQIKVTKRFTNVLRGEECVDILCNHLKCIFYLTVFE